jgi:hypothetical protein
MSFADPILVTSWLLVGAWLIVLTRSLLRSGGLLSPTGTRVLGGAGAALVLISAQAAVADLVADSPGPPRSTRPRWPGSWNTATASPPRS